MQNVNIFEYATRNKLRFPFKGSQSVEDLWSLSLTDLDSIYKTLNKQVKLEDEDSLLTSKAGVSLSLQVQIAIIKHIVEVKLSEKDAKEKALLREKEKQEIMALIADKENEAKRNMSVEELRAMLDKLSE